MRKYGSLPVRPVTLMFPRLVFSTKNPKTMRKIRLGACIVDNTESRV